MDIFTLTLIALPVLLLVFLTWKNRQHLSRQWSGLMEKVARWISPGKREAILNYVICTYCRQGKGIINPVYRMTEGVQYIAGTCNFCGRYICAPLR